MKQCILLAAFGSSNPKAHRTLWRFDEKVRNAFPGVPVRWAFTSGFIRRHLAEEGKKTDSVQKALYKIWFEKFTHVAVQSLHVVPGAEFNDLLGEARALEAGGEKEFEKILVGAPLLARDKDVDRVVRAILRHIPKERVAGEAVVLMGHGTWHRGDSKYDALSERMREKDDSIFIGTMDGARTIYDIAPELVKKGVRKAWLMPLLAVAGAHVVHDMAGDLPDSWKSILTQAGIECTPVLKGTAEYDGFADIWLGHLSDVMSQFD